MLCIYRKILRAPSYTPVETLRGEIGASSMKKRLLQNKLLYLKILKEKDNRLLQEILEKQFEGNYKWIRNLKKETGEIQWRLEDIIRESVNNIKAILKRWDDTIWRNGMESKTPSSIIENLKQGCKKLGMAMTRKV